MISFFPLYGSVNFNVGSVLEEHYLKFESQKTRDFALSLCSLKYLAQYCELSQLLS